MVHNVIVGWVGGRDTQEGIKRGTGRNTQRDQRSRRGPRNEGSCLTDWMEFRERAAANSNMDHGGIRRESSAGDGSCGDGWRSKDFFMEREIKRFKRKSSRHRKRNWGEWARPQVCMVIPSEETAHGGVVLGGGGTEDSAWDWHERGQGEGKSQPVRGPAPALGMC